MQNSIEKSQGKQDERENGMDDSPMTTIEYLRARLLAERSVSKAAKERADELASRVSDLEDQLKNVTLQRKRAEKATLDVLSFLASHGISDISEVYESESDKEESLCESNMSKCDIIKDDEKLGSSEVKEDKESADSDHDSTPSSSRSLSWKGRKETTRHYEKKRLDSSFKRRTSLVHVCSSPRHRAAKSCRQIKRRELRSTVEESRHDSAMSDSQDNGAVNSLDNFAYCLDTGSEEQERYPKKGVEKTSQKNEVSTSQAQAQAYGASGSIHKHECSGAMERALENQAQLIGHYEAQEKAQRDWEEKYGESNISTPDSDVTEERDEDKAEAPGNGHDKKAGRDSNIQGIKPLISHFNSFNAIPHAGAGCSQNHDFSEMKVSVAPYFAFSTVNSSQTREHLVSPSVPSSTEKTPHSQYPAHSVASSCAGSNFSESQLLENLNRHHPLLRQEEPHRLGTVLGALQEAKLLIKRQMNSPLERTSPPVGKSSETSVLAIREADGFQIPVGCPGLFRVPNVLQSQGNQSRLPSSNYSSEFTSSYQYSGTPVIQSDQYSSSPVNPRLSVPGSDPFSCRPNIGSEPGISTRQQRSDFHFDTIQPSSSKTFPSYSSFPDFFPRMSSNQVSSRDPRSEAEIPSSRRPLYYDDDVGPNTYKIMTS